MNIKSIRLALFASLAAFVVAAAPVLRANDKDAGAEYKDHKKHLPLDVSCGKGTPGEHGGPFAVTLKNTSSEALNVKATIIQSVASHNNAKNVDLPEHTIGAGESWTINDLAVEDRVTVKAHGYDKLEVTVPGEKSEKK